MKLSEKVWQQSIKIIEMIKQHPFNQELMNGNLDRKTFGYYLEQDALYLKDCAKLHNLIAEKVASHHQPIFHKYAAETLAVEEMVHSYYKNHLKLPTTNRTTPATHGYTNHLLRMVTLEPVEVAIAAALPCFWIYRELGHLFQKHATPDNPYAEWIRTYSDEAFDASTQEFIAIFNTVADATTDDIRQRMFTAFHNSMIWELHFWNDAYHHRTFDNPYQPSLINVRPVEDETLSSNTTRFW